MVENSKKLYKIVELSNKFKNRVEKTTQDFTKIVSVIGYHFLG